MSPPLREGDSQRRLEESQREHAARLKCVASQLERMDTKLDGMSSRIRSTEENLAEFKGLLVRALDDTAETPTGATGSPL